MNNPVGWHNTSSISHKDAKAVLERFKDKIIWHENDDDLSILDIGCGPGDASKECILSILPKKFKIFKCVDKSSEMINFAKNQYDNLDKRFLFEILDISVSIDKPITEQYNNIFSFYCLHWIPIRKQLVAFTNIYNLLKPNGVLIATMINRNKIHDYYDEMSKSPKWSKYMFDASEITEPIKLVKSDIEQYLKSAGFSIFTVECIETDFRYSVSRHLEFIRSVNPFLDRIPKNQQTEYVQELQDAVLKGSTLNDCQDELQVIQPYKTMFIYAQRT